MSRFKLIFRLPVTLPGGQFSPRPNILDSQHCCIILYIFRDHRADLVVFFACIGSTQPGGRTTHSSLTVQPSGTQPELTVYTTTSTANASGAQDDEAQTAMALSEAQGSSAAASSQADGAAAKAVQETESMPESQMLWPVKAIVSSQSRLRA